jgi:hypothetical protein
VKTNGGKRWAAVAVLALLGSACGGASGGDKESKADKAGAVAEDEKSGTASKGTKSAKDRTAARR